MANKYNTPQEFETALNNNRMIVVMVSADWCHPCQIAKPDVKRILKENNVPLIIFDNEDKEHQDYIKDFKRKFGVRGFPSFIVFLNGKRKAMWSGWADGQVFYDMIEKYLE